MKTEIEERELVVNEALEWVNTPYHVNANLKGIGVDCIRFIQKCFIDSGLIPEFVLPHYSPQWALHQQSELLLDGISKYAKEVEIGLPGDVALFQIGKCWGHSSIVIDWPTVIHACPPRCQIENATQSYPLARLRPRFFSIWRG
jgi:cell wall-associated NlpC family hydrolase